MKRTNLLKDFGQSLCWTASYAIWCSAATGALRIRTTGSIKRQLTNQTADDWRIS
jgi:hypothetical protein